MADFVDDVNMQQIGVTILEDEFSLFSRRRPRVIVTLTPKAIIYKSSQQNVCDIKEKVLNINDIIGCRLQSKTDFDSNEVGVSSAGHNAAHFTIFSYPICKKFLSSRQARHRVAVTFSASNHDTYEENKNVAEQWRIVIKTLALSKEVPLSDIKNLKLPERKKLLVLINPFSGSGKAKNVFKTVTEPMLKEADWPYHVVVTDHQGQAMALAENIDLDKWHAIVIVSGDGLIYETINGLMKHKDWRSAIKIPIGCLPGGSGNALCSSINYSAGESIVDNLALHSTFIVLKSRIVPLDLVTIQMPSQQIFSFLSVMYAFMADLDYESENMRLLGSSRFAVGAVRRIVSLRTYRFRVSFLPVAEYQQKSKTSDETANSPTESRSSKTRLGLLKKIRRFSLHSGSNDSSTSQDLDTVGVVGSDNFVVNGVYKMRSQSVPEKLVGKNNDVPVDNATKRAKSEYVVGDSNNYEHGQGRDFSNLLLTHQDTPSAENSQDNLSADVICDDIEIQDPEHSVCIPDCTGDHAGGEAQCSGATDYETNPEKGDAQHSAMHTNAEEPDIAQEVFECVHVTRDENCIDTDVDITEGTSSSLARTDEHNQTDVPGMSNPGPSSRQDKANNVRLSVENMGDDVVKETLTVTKNSNLLSLTPLLPPLDEPVPSDWVVIEDDFVIMSAAYQTHLSSDCLFSPEARLHEGGIHMMFVRAGIKRSALLQIVTGFEEGKHILSPHVEIVNALAFRIEPLGEKGVLMVDGELMDYGPLQGQILPSIARVLAIR